MEWRDFWKRKLPWSPMTSHALSSKLRELRPLCHRVYPVFPDMSALLKAWHLQVALGASLSGSAALESRPPVEEELPAQGSVEGWCWGRGGEYDSRLTADLDGQMCCPRRYWCDVLLIILQAAVPLMCLEMTDSIRIVRNSGTLTWLGLDPNSPLGVFCGSKLSSCMSPSNVNLALEKVKSWWLMGKLDAYPAKRG